jgi:hypothetical protein
MTDVSEQLYPIICKYCANCIDENGKKKCLADVPWYGASIYCKYFAETSINAEKVKSVGKRKRSLSMKRLMKRVLVETF